MRLANPCRIATAFALLMLGGCLDMASAQDVRGRNLTRVERQPWLRINAGGHTGSVQALAFTSDSRRLCSAGLDKVVQVWDLQAIPRNLQRRFVRERTIRWQVTRGLRGGIFALASAPDDALLAIGGYGAMGSLGEILLVDPVQGTLDDVLQGHRQTVCSLAFSTDGNWLASADTAGRAMLWKRPQWQATTLRRPDEPTYGLERARAIEKQPKFRPILFTGSSHVVLAVMTSETADAPLVWKLRRIDVTDPRSFRDFDGPHHGIVTALAATPDGLRLASADLAGNLYLWDLSGDAGDERPQPVALTPEAIVISICFSPDGKTLVAGTAVGGAAAESQLQVWDLDTRTIQRRRPLCDHVRACAVSPDGKYLAYVGGKDNEVVVEPSGPDDRVIRLRGTGRRILKVAFAAEEPLYRVAFGTQFRHRGFNDYAELNESFDAQRLELDTGKSLEASDWIAADWGAGDWTATPESGGKLQLSRAGEAKGSISRVPQWEGTPRCYCWIPDDQGNPFAIAVGTDVQNSIYVYRLVEEGPCPVLRHFRGHHDYVTSAGVSRDLKYLVSASADGTIRFWSLADYAQGDTPVGRWGAEFAVVGNELQVTSVHQAGPLSSKGVRQGDAITRIDWRNAEGDQSETRPAQMLQQLVQLPWPTQIVFRTSRNGAVRPEFQRLPAWEPLATLFADTEREWAFWTPQGFYDASVNGHTLFGWQINRGLEVLPDFYRADQFRQRLERPDVMEKLLTAGSLEAAFEEAAREPPEDPQQVLGRQIAVTPRVKIVAPSSGTSVRENVAKVTASIEVPSAGKLVSAKVYANGVVASKQELVGRRETESGEEWTYAWEVPLPSDPRNLIQLVVGTDARTTAFNQIVLERAQPAPRQKQPRLYVLAFGINEYDDPEVPRLAYSVEDARAVVDLLRTGSEGIYDLQEATIVTNEKVTPETWRRALERLKEELIDRAEPDDLLVLFLAGHGVRDQRSGRYYFLGHDFRYADFDRGLYSGCLSWGDFQLLADVPCRKLALLDTCHSGAIQPLRSAGLKRAVRTLQEDVVLTVTASAGHEEAAEDKRLGHGVFTTCLLEALLGKADQTGDAVVTLDEVVRYVQESVADRTESRQNPTAGPNDLLPYVSLPLTKSRP